MIQIHHHAAALFEVIYFTAESRIRLLSIAFYVALFPQPIPSSFLFLLPSILFFILLTSPHLLSSPSSPNPVFFLQLLLHKANFELRAFHSAQNINLSSSSVITLSSNAAALFFLKAASFFLFSSIGFHFTHFLLLLLLCFLLTSCLFFFLHFALSLKCSSSFFLNPFAFFHIILSCGLMFSLSRKYNIISLSFPSG